MTVGAVVLWMAGTSPAMMAFVDSSRRALAHYQTAAAGGARCAAWPRNASSEPRSQKYPETSGNLHTSLTML